MNKEVEINELIKDKELFKDWFVRTYVKNFNELPEIKSYDIKFLKEIDKEKEKEQIGKCLKDVIEIVSFSLYGENLTNKVLKKGRKFDINLVRKVSIYIMCEVLKFSKAYTGEMINKDRTTVIHHCKTIGGFLEVDKVFYMKFDRILNKLEERGYLTIKNDKAANVCVEELNYHKNYTEIVFLIAHGFSNKRIAEILCLSDRTTSTHRSEIFKITGCHTSLGLVSWAIEKGIKKNPDLLERFDKLLNENVNAHR
jgi:hypothetical protein